MAEGNGAEIDAARFAAASDATWPGETVGSLGDWRLRFTHGAGSRAASAWAAGPADRPLGDAVTAVEAAYAEQGLTPRFQLWPGDEALDSHLEDRGYRAYDRSHLMARSLEEPLPVPQSPPTPDGRETMAIDVRTPLAVLDDIWAMGGIGPARRSVLARAPGLKAIFLGRVGMRPAGATAVVLDGKVAVTQALYVMPEARRCGLGAVLLRAGASFAKDSGADVMAHSVVAGNDAAITLYQRLGFQIFGSYHYREATR
ncbi:MAG: GNAT family N-acetyltransferase [Pseudomonadota bacterium]